MKFKPGIRSRLFLISFLIIIVMALVSGAYLETELRTWLETRIRTELLREAATIARFIEFSEIADSYEVYDNLADSLSVDTSARVTIIGQDGSVLGDSDINLDQLASSENHSDRPEVIEAHRTGSGISKRYSMTLRTEMLYLAVPFQGCLLYTSPSPRDRTRSRMPSSA